MARVSYIGLSGGVDSSVAAYLLQQAGHEVIGLCHDQLARHTGTARRRLPLARRPALPPNLSPDGSTFRSIRSISRTAVPSPGGGLLCYSEYAKWAHHPTPDVLMATAKSSSTLFLKEALKLGADFRGYGTLLAQGRRDARPDGRTIYKLLAGSDPNNDQSYFLCQLSQEQLSRRRCFRSAHLLKPEVRRIAEQISSATGQTQGSQGICFVGKVDLPVFLQQKLKAKTGNVHENQSHWPKYGTRPSHSSAKRRMQGWARRNERLRIKVPPYAV